MSPGRLFTDEDGNEYDDTIYMDYFDFWWQLDENDVIQFRVKEDES